MCIVAGLLFVPMSFAADWHLFFVAARPRGLGEWLVRAVEIELAVAATLFFTLALLWAVTGSRRLRKLVDAAAVKFGTVMLLIGTTILAAAFVSLVI